MKVSGALTASLVIIALVIGCMAGYYLAPAYREEMTTQEQMTLGPADRSVDLRYLNQMAVHHRGAILLANQVAETSQRPEIVSLAKAIQTDEPILIVELYQWKKEWYNDTSTVKDPEVANLGPADEKQDLRFLNALIAHHSAGIEMTREIRTLSSRAPVLDNADTVEAFLASSRDQLEAWRLAWYGVAAQ